MDNNRGHDLSRFLGSPDRPDGTLGYHELQGFLFAVACSPELIRPSEWMPLVFNNQDALYGDIEEAQSVLQAMLTLYNRINDQVLSADITLPEDINFHTSPLDNIGGSATLGQWSRGFSMGHDWLSDLWEHYIPDALDQELGSSLMVLTFFSDRQLAEAYHKEALESPERSLNELAEKLLGLFEDAMNSYAHMARSIQTVLAEQHQAQEPYVKEEKVGRNDPCPCGSGKKYKKCCGV